MTASSDVITYILYIIILLISVDFILIGLSNLETFNLFKILID